MSRPTVFSRNCVVVPVMAMMIAVVLSLSCKPKQEAGSGPAIRISSPAGASAQDLRATPVADLAPLRSVDGGKDLIAAGRFEPSGSTFSQGVTVTWPLTQTMTAGQTLWIVWLDEANKLWLGTGDTAVVDSSGKQASGTVRHFSTLGLSSTQPSRMQAQAGSSDEQNGTRFTYVNIVRQGKSQVELVDQAKMEAVKKIYEEWVKQAGREAKMDRAKMKQIYQAGDFKSVKTLIENGTILKNHSLDMADHRVAMILETLSGICKENGWKIYRSDSGNQNSGMKSDVDQTIYVYKKDAEGNWVRSEVDDAKLVTEFNKRFPETGVSVESLDIATIAGKDKFPDPRRTKVQLDADGLRAIKQHVADTMESLRRTPGAYTYCGAVVQQMQLRALEAIENQLRIDPTKPGNEAGARPVHPDLEPMLGSNGLNNLVCMEIGPGDDEGEVKPREISQERAIEVMFDSLPPELRKGHAYDAAVANYLEFMHHVADPHPAVKYHLRALDNGVQTVRQLEGQTGRVEYENLKTDAARTAHLETLLGKDLAGSLILQQWKTAFDVSVSLRQAHKKGNLTDDDLVKAFEPLVKEMGGDGGDPKKALDLARKEYDRRCQEFMLHNIIETSTQRVMEWATYDAGDPPKRPDLRQTVDETAMRRSMGLAGKENDAKWQKIRQEVFQNHADIARLQLLYSFREMRPDVVKEIVALAQRRGVQGEALANLNGLVAESKSMFFGYNRYIEYKPLYHAYFKAIAAQKLAQFRENIKEHILIQAGFIDTDAGRQVTKLFKSGSPAAFETRVNEFFAKNKAAGITSRYIRNAIFDYGNVNGVIQVLQAYSESGGDPNATWDAMVREGVSALPLVGQVYSIAQSPSAGDAAYNGAIMIVCMIVPQAGMAAMALSLSEAGVALYESEISKPLNDTVADALYCGYVGPSLYSFDKEPPRFEPTDAEALKQAQAQADSLKAATAPADRQRLANWFVQIKQLSDRKTNWEAFEAQKRKRQTYEGSAILGTGAQLTQRRLAIPLPLDRVEPIIFYNPSTEGPVDFTVPALTGEQTQRLSQIENLIQTKSTQITEEDCYEYDKLMMQKRRYDRAQRYLERAKTNHELMHRIRTDSLWPWIALRAPDREMVDARAFMTTWCQTNNDAAVKELKLQQVSIGNQIPAAASEELGQRLLEDLTRSRQLWQYQEFLKQEQVKQEEDRYQRRRGALAGEAIADAAVRPPNFLSPETQAVLREAGVDIDRALSLSPLSEAIDERHVPMVAPEIEISLRKVPLGSDEYEFRPDIQVTADPTVYQPPYRAKMFQLDPQTAQQAASARSYRGLPLSDESVKYIQEQLKKMGPITADMTPFTPVALVFVFCDGCEIPERIVPETVAGLPALKKYDVPDEGVQAYLFGSVALAPEPEKLPSGPLQIRTIRLKKNPWNGIEITSQAMTQLDPTKPQQGLKFVIYRSQAASEPLAIFNKLFVHYVFPDTPIQEYKNDANEPINSCRVAKDRFLICDHISTIHDFDRLPHKPYYYQIAQIPVVRVDDEMKEKGKEVRSNILKPDTEAEIRISGERNADGTFKLNHYYANDWCSIAAALGMVNQQFDAWGAHFTVTAGGWTGHFFSGGKAGDRYIGNASAYSAFAGIGVPLGPGGGTVSISAQGEGFSASASVTVGSDPQGIAGAAQQAEYSKARMDRDVASLARDVNDAEAELKRMDWVNTQKPKDMSDYSAVGSWTENMRNYIGRRAFFRERKEYNLPWLKNSCKESVARANGDWRALIACAAGLLEVDRSRYEIEMERIASLETLNNTLAACSNVPAEAKSRIEQTRKEIEQSRQSAERTYRLSQLTDHEMTARAALAAGDAGVYERAQNERIKLLSRPEDKSDLAGVYNAMAQGMVILTGDRAKGVDLWNKGLQADIESRPDRAQQTRQNWENNRPVWWPNGG